MITIIVILLALRRPVKVKQHSVGKQNYWRSLNQYCLWNNVVSVSYAKQLVTHFFTAFLYKQQQQKQ